MTCVYGGCGGEQLCYRRNFWCKSDLGPQRRANAYLYLVFSPVAQNFYCYKAISMGIEEDPSSTFNWTTEKIETCDNGALCQESVLVIKSGKNEKGTVGLDGRKNDYVHGKAILPFPGQLRPPSTFLPSYLITGAEAAILSTKGCISEGTPAITFAQHSPPPGIITVSYSNYCEDSLCNNREDLLQLWNPHVILGTLGGERLVIRTL